MLQLLLNLRIEFASDVDNARSIYASALSGTSNEPSWQELIDVGWLTVVWSRFAVSYELVRAAERATPPLSALSALLERRFDEIYHANEQPSGRPDLDDVTTKIRNKELRAEQVRCQSPNWVAARLWDRKPSDYRSQSTALRAWFDRWEKLGHPSFVPQVVWDGDALAAFREAVFTVLESDRGVGGWEEVRDYFIRKHALKFEESEDTIATRVPAVPDSLVDRISWVYEVFDGDRMREYGDLAWLVSLLLSDAETENNGAAPHPVAKRLIDLAQESADLFFILVFQLSAKPLLLADLVLHPATTAVACRLVAQWEQASDALDRDLTDLDNRNAKSIAFADSVSILGHFLARSDTDPREAAALLAWFHQKIPYGMADDPESHEALLSTLKSELSQQPRRILRTMVDILSNTSDMQLDTSRFSAALDVVDFGDLSEKVDPIPFADAYIRLVSTTTRSQRAVVLSVSGAAALVRMGLRTPCALSRRFLCPIDTTQRLEECSEEEYYSLVFDLGRSLRVHIRTLTRSISGFSRSVPEEVTSALVVAIRSGALAHREKGRIAAFSPEYEEHGSDGYVGRPIAADIGSAIHELSEDERDAVLSAVLETDEPMLLAQLLQFAPYVTRDRIRRRVEALTPSESGEVFSLTHLQVRIETLLSAGLANAAERFIEVEKELRTLGPVVGRVVARLRTRLRLHLLRKQWEEIRKAKVPDGLNSAEQRSAAETMSFYKGLALLDDPSGDDSSAENIFSQLHQERPDVFAYFVNLFAVRICILLEDTPFKQLNNEQVVHGRELLADTEKNRFQYGVVSNKETDIYICNRAQLLIAVCQPQQALDLLSTMNTKNLRDEVAAYSAVALARLKRVSEAQAVIEQATEQVGQTDVLRTARDLIRATPYANVVIPLASDDVVSRVKSALLDLKQMGHVEQARVVHPTGSTEEHVIAHVRAVGSSISEMVPMMRNLGMDSREDDLNAFFKELLTQRLEFLGWSVGDQSKGGFTRKGNPGERDLVLRLGATTVTVLEGIVCRPGRSYRSDLISHFSRLLAYGTCDLFFLVVYSYVLRPSEVLDTMKHISRHRAPVQFSYQRRRDIPHEDSRPSGFVTYFREEFREVKVVFLVLDMHQGAQRSAVQIRDR